MSILRVEADSLTGKAGRPASTKLQYISITPIRSTWKDLTMVKVHAQYKQGRLLDRILPLTVLTVDADLTSNTRLARCVCERHALQGWHHPWGKPH